MALQDKVNLIFYLREQSEGKHWMSHDPISHDNLTLPTKVPLKMSPRIPADGQTQEKVTCHDDAPGKLVTVPRPLRHHPSMNTWALIWGWHLCVPVQEWDGALLTGTNSWAFLVSGDKGTHHSSPGWVADAGIWQGGGIFDEEGGLEASHFIVPSAAMETCRSAAVSRQKLTLLGRDIDSCLTIRKANSGQQITGSLLLGDEGQEQVLI